MESEKCIICKLPVSESDDAWFIGWSHGIGCWQHETCTNDDLNGKFSLDAASFLSFRICLLVYVMIGCFIFNRC